MPIEIKDGKPVIVGCYWQDPNYYNFLGQPNEDQIDLGSLKYGRSDYEWLRPPNLVPENERYYEQSEKGNWWLRPNWRELLEKPDPYARRPLNTDPTTGVVIWDPIKLQEVMSANAEVVSWILQILDNRNDSKLRLRFQSCLQKVFLTEYTDDKVANRWFGGYVDRVAGCLLNNFQATPEFWFDALMKCEQLKTNYSQFLPGVLRPKVQYKKRVSPVNQEVS